MGSWTVAISLLCPWNSQGKNTGLGSHSLLQWIFPIQGLNLGLLALQADSLSSELQGRSKVTQSCLTLCNPTDYTVHGILQATILEWVAVPFSRGSSHPEIEPRSPALQEDSSLSEPPGKLALSKNKVGWRVRVLMISLQLLNDHNSSLHLSSTNS